jgi:hypothetical protein
MQQDGRIEKFDVVLLGPNPEMGGYIELHGSAEQIAAVQEDDEFRRNTVDAELCVANLRHIEGYTDAGVAEAVEMYREAVAKVPQTT